MEASKKKLNSFSAYSFLSIAWGGSLAATALYIGLPIYSFIMSSPLPIWYDLKVRITPPVEVVNSFSGNNNYSLDLSSANIMIMNPSLLTEILGMFLPIIMWSSITLGIFLLRKIIRNVHDGKQFCIENIKYTRWIAWIIIIIPHLMNLIKNILINSIPANTIVNGFKIHKQISGPIQVLNFALVPEYILLGMIIFVFAEVFKEGNKIKQENDLTV